MPVCINCKNSNLIKIIKIGSQPLSGIFLNKIITKPKKIFSRSFSMLEMQTYSNWKNNKSPKNVW